MQTKGDRPARGARNQALFREVNERIEQISEDQGIPTSELWDLLCECADTDCTENIAVTHDEYEAVRRVPTRFVVKPGHVYPDIERVVDENERYAVVEKFGDAGVVSVKLDPRRRSARIEG